MRFSGSEPPKAKISGPPIGAPPPWMLMQDVRTPAVRSWMRPFFTVKVTLWPESLLPAYLTVRAEAGAAVTARAATTARNAVIVRMGRVSWEGASADFGRRAHRVVGLEEVVRVVERLDLAQAVPGVGIEKLLASEAASTKLG